MPSAWRKDVENARLIDQSWPPTAPRSTNEAVGLCDRAQEGRTLSDGRVLIPCTRPVPLPPVTRTACPYCGVRAAACRPRPDGIGRRAITTRRSRSSGELRAASAPKALHWERNARPSTAACSTRCCGARRRQPHAGSIGDTALSTVADRVPPRGSRRERTERGRLFISPGSF